MAWSADCLINTPGAWFSQNLPSTEVFCVLAVRVLFPFNDLMRSLNRVYNQLFLTVTFFPSALDHNANMKACMWPASGSTTSHHFINMWPFSEKKKNNTISLPGRLCNHPANVSPALFLKHHTLMELFSSSQEQHLAMQELYVTFIEEPLCVLTIAHNSTPRGTCSWSDVVCKSRLRAPRGSRQWHIHSMIGGVSWRGS